MNPNVAPILEPGAETPQQPEEHLPPVEDVGPAVEGGRFGEKQQISPEKYYERTLPRYHIPSDEMLARIRENGLDLVPMLFNASTGNAVVLNGAVGDVVRRETQVARKKLSGELLQQSYRNIHRGTLESLYTEMPDDLRGDFQNGIVELRYGIICKRPTACAPTREHAGVTAFSEEPKIAAAAEMVDFANTNWEDVLGTEPFALEKIQTRESAGGARGKEKTFTPPKPIAPRYLMNTLQQYRYELGRMMSAGDKRAWDDGAEKYTELVSCLPQYWEYRYAVQDMIARLRKGELETLPKTLLSVASGPSVEVQAHADFEYLYQSNGLEKPEIFNIDISTQMLKKGAERWKERATLLGSEQAERAPLNIAGNMLKLPIADGKFEMVECSSLDNVIKRSPEDVSVALGEMVRVLKDGGLLRLSHKEYLPDTFFEKLRAHGMTLITAPHTTYSPPQEVLDRMKTVLDQKAFERAKRIVFRGAEYVLARKSTMATPAQAVTFSPSDLIGQTHEQETPVAVPIEIEATKPFRRRETDLETANRIKESLDYFLNMEGGGQLFNVHNRRSRKQKQVPYKALRKEIVYTAAKSLIEEADDALVMKNGKPYSLKGKLAHYTERKREAGSGAVPLDEVGSLDWPYREELLQKYAPFIYKELQGVGVFREKSVRGPAFTNN